MEEKKRTEVGEEGKEQDDVPLYHSIKTVVKWVKTV
jgi:hypothetical protein